MKGKYTKLRQNIFAIGIGSILAVALFYVVDNPDFFQANVLGIQDQDLLQSKKRDVGYKIQDHVLDVYLPKAEKYSTVEFVVTFDSQQVTFDLQNVEKQWTLETRFAQEWELIIVFSPQEDLKKDESLFMIPFEWDNPFLVLMKAEALKDGKEKLLAIGRLDEQTVH